MAMPEGYWHELYTANPFPYNYVFVYSDEQLDWFAEWLTKEYPIFTDAHDHIARIRDAIGEAHGLVYWQGNDFPAVVYIPVSVHVNIPAGRRTGMDSFMNTLTHELSHLVLDICAVVGYNPVHEQEPYTYLIGRMMSHALENLPFTMPDLKTLVESAASEDGEHNVMDEKTVTGSRMLTWPELYEVTQCGYEVGRDDLRNIVTESLQELKAVRHVHLNCIDENIIVEVTVVMSALLSLKTHTKWGALFGKNMEFTGSYDG